MMDNVPTVQHDNHSMLLRAGDDPRGPLEGYITLPKERYDAINELAECKSADLAKMALSAKAREASDKIVKLEKRAAIITVVLYVLLALQIMAIFVLLVFA
jgi:hypothetical protein